MKKFMPTFNPWHISNEIEKSITTLSKALRDLTSDQNNLVKEVNQVTVYAVDYIDVVRYYNPQENLKYFAFAFEKDDDLENVDPTLEADLFDKQDFVSERILFTSCVPILLLPSIHAELVTDFQYVQKRFFDTAEEVIIKGRKIFREAGEDTIQELQEILKRHKDKEQSLNYTYEAIVQFLKIHASDVLSLYMYRVKTPMARLRRLINESTLRRLEQFPWEEPPFCLSKESAEKIRDITIDEHDWEMWEECLNRKDHPRYESRASANLLYARTLGYIDKLNRVLYEDAEKHEFAQPHVKVCFLTQATSMLNATDDEYLPYRYDKRYRPEIRLTRLSLPVYFGSPESEPRGHLRSAGMLDKEKADLLSGVTYAYQEETRKYYQSGEQTNEFRKIEVDETKQKFRETWIAYESALLLEGLQLDRPKNIESPDDSEEKIRFLGLVNEMLSLDDLDHALTDWWIKPSFSDFTSDLIEFAAGKEPPGKVLAIREQPYRSVLVKASTSWPFIVEISIGEMVDSLLEEKNFGKALKDFLKITPSARTRHAEVNTILYDKLFILAYFLAASESWRAAEPLCRLAIEYGTYRAKCEARILLSLVLMGIGQDDENYKTYRKGIDILQEEIEHAKEKRINDGLDESAICAFEGDPRFLLLKALQICHVNGQEFLAPLRKDIDSSFEHAIALCDEAIVNVSTFEGHDTGWSDLITARARQFQLVAFLIKKLVADEGQAAIWLQTLKTSIAALKELNWVDVDLPPGMQAIVCMAQLELEHRTLTHDQIINIFEKAKKFRSKSLMICIPKIFWEEWEDKWSKQL